ncbi:MULTISPECIES: DUF397 domain-containing protein [Polymorphospora]|uniref:DUF397 domain-containing protein n=1 Tax=Polymorphospora lycopeni TaxID=3140240 RepID=A0ABV5CHP0_9ACTN
METEEFRVDLTRAVWRKSSRSGPNCDNCVEVAQLAGVVAVRDSKDPTGPALIFDPREWAAFVGGARVGGFVAS